MPPRGTTVEEITRKFAGARYFSKLDVKNGYWSVKLDEESSLLTTFNTPFGWYCYERMPFGFVMSQDVFQHKMDQILERCPGTIGIADDIAVYGKTEQEHDRHLHNLMQVAAKNGLVFNSQKCAVKTPQITFFGMVYDQHGVHPDPSKVEAVKCMAPPQTKTELQEFIGMATYLSPFIPRFSVHTADLRALLKKDTEFVWTASYQQAYNKVKDLVCEETTLAFFDAIKEMVIQVDASSRGLGANPSRSHPNHSVELNNGTQTSSASYWP